MTAVVMLTLLATGCSGQTAKVPTRITGAEQLVECCEIQRLSVPVENASSPPVLAADGSAIFFTEDRSPSPTQLVRVQLRSGSTTRTPLTHVRELETGAVLPGGRFELWPLGESPDLLAVARGDWSGMSRAWVLDLADGSTTELAIGDAPSGSAMVKAGGPGATIPLSFGQPVLSPSGSFLAAILASYLPGLPSEEHFVGVFSVSRGTRVLIRALPAVGTGGSSSREADADQEHAQPLVPSEAEIRWLDDEVLAVQLVGASRSEPVLLAQGESGTWSEVKRPGALPVSGHKRRALVQDSPILVGGLQGSPDQVAIDVGVLFGSEAGSVWAAEIDDETVAVKRSQTGDGDRLDIVVAKRRGGISRTK